MPVIRFRFEHRTVFLHTTTVSPDHDCVSERGLRSAAAVISNDDDCGELLAIDAVPNPGDSLVDFALVERADGDIRLVGKHPPKRKRLN